MIRTAAMVAMVLMAVACTGPSAPDPNPNPNPNPTGHQTQPTTGESRSTPTSSVPGGTTPIDLGPAEVFAPETPGSYPVVVTIHGGGWVAGDPGQMAPLAAGLAERGMVAFNVTYRAMDAGGRFPGMVEDIACGIVEARNRAPEYTDTPDRLFVVAHSAGAHLAALVAMAPDVFACPDGSVPEVNGFVGLAGPYDVTRVAILSTLFGATLDDAPDLWASGNPRSYVETAPDVPVILVHGDADEVVPPSFSTDFAAALEAVGRSVEIVTLPGATHSDVRDPAVVGDLIAGFVTGG